MIVMSIMMSILMSTLMSTQNATPHECRPTLFHFVCIFYHFNKLIQDSIAGPEKRLLSGIFFSGRYFIGNQSDIP